MTRNILCLLEAAPMPTSNLIDWMDEVDPYAIQRLAVVKGMFIATIMVFVYWLFRPLSFSAYIIPTILIYYYESPALKTTKEKGKFSIFIFTAFMIGNITFYLIFPFKIIFFYYAILFFALLYYLLDIYYNQLKTAAMLILAYSLFTLSDTPPANFQVVYTLFFSSMLSIITMLICLRIYPNDAFEIWSRALQKYIACIEVDIEKAICGHQKGLSADEVKHLSTIRAFRTLIPTPVMRNACRISVNIRNIQFALSSLYFEQMNVAFWRTVQDIFKELRTNIQSRKTYSFQKELIAETPLQQYVAYCLTKTIRHWNQLCCIQNN